MICEDWSPLCYELLNNCKDALQTVFVSTFAESSPARFSILQNHLKHAIEAVISKVQWMPQKIGRRMNPVS